MCGGKVAIPPIVKEKRRNSEKRKEKSRDAARCRRSKESEIFSDLQSQLPLAESVARNLDKASVMRLTIATLKVREMAHALHAQEEEEEEAVPLTTTPFLQYYLEALNGFLLILSDNGDVLFISEKVEEILGIHYSDVLGHPLSDLVHPCDQQEVDSLLSCTSRPTTVEVDEEDDEIDLFLRFKSALKTRAKNLKHNSHRVIHCLGHKFVVPASPETSKPRSFYVLLVGTTLPHPSQVDVALSDTAIFVTRHSPDMKFTHADDKITGFLGYKSSDLIGQSVYCFHHVQDAERMLKAFKILLSKGQVETGAYRFLARHGGHVWLLTQATLICDSATHKPECVVCLNHVITKVEHADQIVSEQQEQKQQPILSIEEHQPQSQHQQQESASAEVDRPSGGLSTTGAIFARKKQPAAAAMNRHFLNFPDTDILLFQGGGGGEKGKLDLDLFSDDGIEDPFSYREDSLSSPSGGTPESSLHLQLSSSSSPDHRCFPDTPDSGSLSDVPGFDPIDSSFSNLRFIPTDKEDYEEDLDFRAPFIPMQMDDDFPLLSPSSHVMWGPPQEPPRKQLHAAPASATATQHDRLSDIDPSPSKQSKSAGTLQQSSLKSSLAALLQSDTHHNNNKKNNRHNNDRNNNNKRWHASDSKARQRNNNNFTPSRNYPSGGHIIMLDSVPPVTKKPSPAATKPQVGQQRKTPSIGSHTSTMRVNDRLIKVQVCVSELPSSSKVEQKQPFPSPPDPPPKRTLPPTESPKRMRLDNTPQHQGSTHNSVLLNLLISGEDASRGYLCSGSSRHSDNKFEPAVLSLPANDLHPDLEEENSLLLDSYLKIQYEDDMLRSDELLSALDHPLLRNTPISI